MKKLILSGIALALFLPPFTSARAQAENDLNGIIERTLKEKNSDWLCKNGPAGKPGPDSPHGTFYNFVCKREQQSVLASVFLGNSKQDAVKLLEFSQQVLQVNASKPLAGIGEQAYAYAGHGSAWITFRKANVFAQVTVSAIDPRKVPNPSPEIDAFTNQALEIAKHLAQSLAEKTAGTEQIVGQRLWRSSSISRKP